MVIPPILLLYCSLATAVYLALANWALSTYERRLIAKGMWPSSESDSPDNSTASARIWNFLAQWLLFAALPMGFYSWLYLILPLEGPRAGVSIALWTIVIGTLPYAIAVSARHRVPFVALVFLMFSQLVKLLGTLALIGILFSL